MRNWQSVTALRLSLALLVLASACPWHARPEPKPGVDVLVLAPHPDDEVLLAGGVMRRAIAGGQKVAVIVVTNGDLGCTRDGTVRQEETVSALLSLGLQERDIHFLGYPDGQLAELTHTPLPARARHEVDGGCDIVAGTWASHGEGFTDEHHRRTGQVGPWTSDALTEDLAALIDRLQPRNVYLPHLIDAHPDHAAVDAYFRRALERMDYAPRLYRGVVHANDCWPGDCVHPYTPDAGFTPLPRALSGYLPRERLAIDPEAKLALISHYHSQLEADLKSDWLASFARREEDFFPQELTRGDGGWISAPERHSFTVTFTTPAHFTVTSASGPETYEVGRTGDRFTLWRVDPDGDRTRVGRWGSPGEGPRTIRFDPRPEDGDVTEWSLFGPEGLVGGQVVPHVLLGVSDAQAGLAPQ
jgi:LmbE family N-acetylglucosaminyl deacetylase